MGPKRRSGRSVSASRGEVEKNYQVNSLGIRNKMYDDWGVVVKKNSTKDEIRDAVVKVVKKLLPVVLDGNFRKDLKKINSEKRIWRDYLLNRRELLLSVTMQEFCSGLKPNLVHIMRVEKRWEKIFRSGEVVVGALLQVCLCFFIHFVIACVER